MDNVWVDEPQIITDFNDNEFVYALCKCPLPLNYAISIPQKQCKSINGIYHFKCSKCGTEGAIHKGGRINL